jgi:hypothetical protein
VLGKAITARLRHMEWEMRSRRTLERVGWGQYRLLPEWQARAQEWIDSGDALKFRQMRARQIQKQIDADEKVIKKRQGPSPWAQVNRQYRKRRKARRTQTGRVIQALRAAGGPLKWEDVAKAAGPNGWSKANRKKAIESGQVVYDRLTRLYDLPTRDTAPSMAQDREEFLLLALAAGGAMSLAEMGDALGVDRRVIKDAPLKRCRKRGEIERTGPGRYELTDKGMEAVKAIVARNIEGES